MQCSRPQKTPWRRISGRSFFRQHRYLDDFRNIEKFEKLKLVILDFHFQHNGKQEIFKTVFILWFWTIFDLRFGLLAKFCAGRNIPDLQGRLGGEFLAESKCCLIYSVNCGIPNFPNATRSFFCVLFCDFCVFYIFVWFWSFFCSIWGLV